MNKSEMLNFIDNRFRNCNPEFLKLSQVYFEDAVEDTFYNFIKQIGNTIGADWVKGGCSKSVFHFKEFDNYVFKIPYIGFFHIEDEDNQYFKDCAEQERVPTYFCFDDVVLYKNANNDGAYPVDANDYCAVEEYIYRIARKYNVNQMFTKTAFLGFICGVPVYVSSCAGKTYSRKKSNCRKTDKIAKAMIEKSTKIAIVNFILQSVAFSLKRMVEGQLNALLIFFIKKRFQTCILATMVMMLLAI